MVRSDFGRLVFDFSHISCYNFFFASNTFLNQFYIFSDLNHFRKTKMSENSTENTYFLRKLTPLFRVVCKCALYLFHSEFWILKIKILFLNFSMQILNYFINLSVLFGTSLFLKAFCILDGLFDALQTF